jgi:dolichol-phosphate mannosyltransferase
VSGNAAAARTVRIVLPAFNEADNLPALLGALRDTMNDHHLAYEIILVDDASTDETAAVARRWADQLPLQLISHAVNLGLGGALRDGLTLALARCAERDIIVTMDADDTHQPGPILRMIRLIDEGYDVIIASRYQPGSRVYGVPALRRFMSRAASLLMRVLFPTRGVRDFTCGYRAYRATALRQAVARYGSGFLDQDGFQCMVDILLKLRSLDVLFAEVPLLLRYDRKSGKSKMNVARTARQTMSLLMRRRLGS